MFNSLSGNAFSGGWNFRPGQTIEGVDWYRQFQNQYSAQYKPVICIHPDCLICKENNEKNEQLKMAMEKAARKNKIAYKKRCDAWIKKIRSFK